MPAGLRDVVAVAAGGRWVDVSTAPEVDSYEAHDVSAALRRDGTVVTWGDALPAGGCKVGQVRSIAAGSNYLVALGRNGRVRMCGRLETPPPAERSVRSVAAGANHNLALTRGGKVVGWGSNAGRAATAPTGLSHVVAVAAGHTTSYALRRDGTVVAWGDGSSRQTEVPAGLRDVVVLAAGPQHVLALRRNGTVVGWGAACYVADNCPVEHGASAVPAGLTDVVAIATGNSPAWLRGDGTVVAWGSDSPSDPSSIVVPPGLRDVISIAVGREVSLAVRRDGSVVHWGMYGGGWDILPFSDVHRVAVGGSHVVALGRRS